MIFPFEPGEAVLCRAVLSIESIRRTCSIENFDEIFSFH